MKELIETENLEPINASFELGDAVQLVEDLPARFNQTQTEFFLKGRKGNILQKHDDYYDLLFHSNLVHGKLLTINSVHCSFLEKLKTETT